MDTRIIKSINYYLLILLGLFGTSWLIWSRFICERMNPEYASVSSQRWEP